MMRFFTPELVEEFGSDDPTIADRADEAWESAIKNYREHLSKLPPKLREFAESICLHDAQYLGISKVAGPFVEGGPAIVSLKHREQFVFLFYILVKEPTLVAAAATKVIETNEVLWLYDEVDIDPSGVFIHEILLSNSKILTLHFIAIETSVVDRPNDAYKPFHVCSVQPSRG